MKNFKFLIGSFVLGTGLILAGCNNAGESPASSSQSSSGPTARELALARIQEGKEAKNITIEATMTQNTDFGNGSYMGMKKMGMTSTSVGKLNEKGEAYTESATPTSNFKYVISDLAEMAHVDVPQDEDTLKALVEAYKDYIFHYGVTTYEYKSIDLANDVFEVDVACTNKSFQGYAYDETEKQFVGYEKHSGDLMAQYVIDSNKIKDLAEEYEMITSSFDILDDATANGTFNEAENKFTYAPNKEYPYGVDGNMMNITVTSVVVELGNDNVFKFHFDAHVNAAANPDPYMPMPAYSVTMSYDLVLKNKGTTTIEAPAYQGALYPCDHQGSSHKYEDLGDKCREYCNTCGKYLADATDHIYVGEEIVCNHCGHVKDSADYQLTAFETAIGRPIESLYKVGDKVYSQRNDSSIGYLLDVKSVSGSSSSNVMVEGDNTLAGKVVFYMERDSSNGRDINALQYVSVEASSKATESNVRYTNGTVTLIKDIEVTGTIGDLLDMTVDEILAAYPGSSVVGTQNVIFYYVFPSPILSA